MKDIFINDIVPTICAIALVLVLALGLVGLVNGCSSRDWNNGICPKCDEYYELRGANDGLKYYVCPDCHAEVHRY